MKKTIIIGGGITGLVAAYKLAPNVILLEKEKELGGLLASYRISNFFIEKYYHHFFVGDKSLIFLLKELGLEKRIVWKVAKVGYFFERKIYPLNTPIEILSFPFLGFLDKIKLAFFTLRSKLEKPEKFDEILAKDLILKTCGKRVLDNFFLPLLKSKFGENYEKISAAWLIGRVALRAHRGLKGERLGYLKGGFQSLIEFLGKAIEKRGGEIKTAFDVSKIIVKDGKVKGVIGNNEFLPADRIISTVGPQTLKKIIEPELLKLDNSFQYQGIACLLLSLKTNLLKDIYWLNIKANVPFGAVIEHTNFLPFSDYGEHLIYLVSYFQNPHDPLWRLPEEKVVELYLKGLKKIFPDFKESNIQWWRLSCHLEAGPIYEKGYKSKIIHYATPIEGFYLAGMFSQPNYPERSINGSIQAGLKVAEFLSLHQNSNVLQ